MTTTTLPFATRIAEYFILLSTREGKPITNKKLQKLLYYAQAWSLAINDKKLFDEPIEAWVHGPAIRSVYVQYKDFGFGPIKQVVTPASFKDISVDDTKILDEIWRVYGKYDADYLELLTHSEEPWQNARAGIEPDEGSSNIIDPTSMRDYYRAKLEAVASK